MAGWGSVLTASQRFKAAAIAAVAAPVAGSLARSYRWIEDGTEHLTAVEASGRRPIFALWHGRILPSTIYFRDRGIVALTSRNFDGEWIARLMRRFGYAQARGSTSRGGARALIELKRAIEGGRAVAFTVDGPRGPARVAQPGAVWLAAATGQPIVPFHIEASRAWTARSWDRSLVPKPFARLAIAIGAPIEVGPDTSAPAIEAGRVHLQNVLQALEVRATDLLP